MTIEKNINKRILCQNRFTLLLLFSLFFGWLFVTRPSIHGNDGVQNYVWLHSTLFDGDLDFTNDYSYYLTRQAHWFDHKDIPKDPVTNLPVNLYGVGNAILWTPWVLLFQGIGVISNYLLSTQFDLSGFGWLAMAGVSFGSSFYASLGLFLLYKQGERWSSPIIAFWAVVLIWFATPLFFYMYLHPSMSHANSFFLASALLYLSIKGKKLVGWFSLGLISGLLCVTRLQDGVLLIPIGIYELIRLWKIRKTVKISELILKCYVPAIIGFIIPVTFQLIGWKILQGGYFTGPRGYLTQGTINLLNPAYIRQALFSARHGLFFCHPILLFALLGLFLKPDKLRHEKLIAISAFAIVTWVIGSWNIWWAGASFGQRMFISVFPFLYIGFTQYSISINRTVRNVALLLTVTAIIWNFIYILQYATGRIDRQGSISYSEILSWKKVPETPQ